MHNGALNNLSVTQEQPRFSTSRPYSELSAAGGSSSSEGAGIQTFLLCPTVWVVPWELDGLGGVFFQNSLNLFEKAGIIDG